MPKVYADGMWWWVAQSPWQHTTGYYGGARAPADVAFEELGRHSTLGKRDRNKPRRYATESVWLEEVMKAENLAKKQRQSEPDWGDPNWCINSMAAVTLYKINLSRNNFSVLCPSVKSHAGLRHR